MVADIKLHGYISLPTNSIPANDENVLVRYGNIKGKGIKYELTEQSKLRTNVDIKNVEKDKSKLQLLK